MRASKDPEKEGRQASNQSSKCGNVDSSKTVAHEAYDRPANSLGYWK
jgi:hypothetical protein